MCGIVGLGGGRRDGWLHAVCAKYDAGISGGQEGNMRSQIPYPALAWGREGRQGESRQYVAMVAVADAGPSDLHGQTTNRANQPAGQPAQAMLRWRNQGASGRVDDAGDPTLTTHCPRCFPAMKSATVPLAAWRRQRGVDDDVGMPASPSPGAEAPSPLSICRALFFWSLSALFFSFLACGLMRRYRQQL